MSSEWLNLIGSNNKKIFKSIQDVIPALDETYFIPDRVYSNCKCISLYLLGYNIYCCILILYLIGCKISADSYWGAEAP